MVHHLLAPYCVSILGGSDGVNAGRFGIEIKKGKAVGLSLRAAPRPSLPSALRMPSIFVEGVLGLLPLLLPQLVLRMLVLLLLLVLLLKHAGFVGEFDVALLHPLIVLLFRLSETGFVL